MPLAYLDVLREAKFRAFDQAARQPLTCLMTRLCAGPLAVGGKSSAAAEDPEFAEYLAESLRKQELREQIIAGEKLNISLPAEVMCTHSGRTRCRRMRSALRGCPHEDIQYSRFYD